MNVDMEFDKWINYDGLTADLRKQLEQMDEREKDDAFYTELEFGTAGMRGVMGPGTNRMNIYTIRKANVGFAKYLLENVENATSRGVVIAYDSRINSVEFAWESARVLASHGIKSYVFEGPRPTPELSFAVRHLNCAGGIVITASHNPPAYNGYKIYDESGAQVLPDAGNIVIAGVKAVDDVFTIEVKTDRELQAAGLIETVGSEIDAIYLERIKELQLNSEIDKSDLAIVFSPLHGTAGELTEELLLYCGYKRLFMVAEQTDPDGNFPTVGYPNPEEAAAFEYAIRDGKLVDADIILATDPDADRMGVAVKVTVGECTTKSDSVFATSTLVLNDTSDYVLLTGNQTGAVLTHYILSQRQAKGTLPAKGRFFDTIVSSELAAKIARSYGLETISTLTGFKFIGEQARLMEGTEYEYVFGYEESYGSLIGDFVRDKDAIQAVLILCEAAAYYKAQGKTLCDVLEDIYAEYGYFEEALENIALSGKEGSAKIQKLLTEFRNNPPQRIAELQVTAVEDYKKQARIADGQTTKIDLPSADVLKYILADGSWFVLRPSGTEPKAKVYISVVTNSKDETTKRVELIKADVMALVDQILSS